MASESYVHAGVVNFGTSGTSSSVAAPGTSTSQPQLGPRQDFTLGITAYGNLVTTTASTTASSTAAATVVLQASHDKQAWFGISSASATATLTSTSTGTVLSLTTAAAAGANQISQRYPYLRTVVSITGTGSAQAQVSY